MESGRLLSWSSFQTPQSAVIKTAMKSAPYTGSASSVCCVHWSYCTITMPHICIAMLAHCSGAIGRRKKSVHSNAETAIAPDFSRLIDVGSAHKKSLNASWLLIK